MDRDTEAGQSLRQAARAPGGAPPPRVAWGGGWLVVLALPLWLSQLSVQWLLLSGVGVAIWGAFALRRRDRLAVAVALVLLAAVGMAAGVQARLGVIARDWSRVEREVGEAAAAELNRALDRLVERGERAVAGIEATVSAAPAAQPDPRLFARLEELQAGSGITALALFDPEGVPVAWAGEHRGTVPPAVRLGARSYIFHEGPLFSYLYFVRELEGGGTAMAAVLLEANLEVGEGSVPFAERFAAQRGITPRFSLPSRARGETVWDWSTEDGPILSVTFAALTQEHWWERVVERGRRGVGLAWLASLAGLSVLWYRRRAGPPGVPVVVGTAGAALAPLGEIVGVEQIFSPLQFVLPLPVDITLGLLILLLLGTSLWLLTRAVDRPARWSLPAWAQALLAVPLLPLVIQLVDRSATGGLLASRPAGGLALQLATVLLLAVPLYLLLSRGPRTGGGRSSGVALLAAGAVLSIALAVGVVLLWRPDRNFTPWSAALWAVPFFLISLALTRLSTQHARIRSWLAAGWVASAAALPHLWALHTGAELRNAEHEVRRLGTQPDPFLHFLLRKFAQQALTFAAEGEEGVNLLYHSWVASGLAREGHEARLSVWHADSVETELRLSPQDSVPGVIPRLVRAVSDQREPEIFHFTEVEDLHYLLLVPLPDERVLSVAVPPRRQLGRSTALARFLHPESEAEEAAYNETLLLLPMAGPPTPADTGRAMRIQWVRTETAWRSEAQARFPSGWVHAHLFVRTPSLQLVLVRAVLAQAALLGLLVLLWLAARVLRGDADHAPRIRRQWVRSFRARLTVTLFLFFLIPTAFFGAVAYGAVAREVVLTAAGLARRALEQAAPVVQRFGIARVGEEIRSDLLLYQNGMLERAAAPEVIDLGLFHTWLPPGVYLDFLRAEDTEALEERRLGENEYLVAYRRIDPRVVLAAPVPLASEEITRRRQEFRDLALLVSLLGGAFSIVLSLLAGRTLSRPIDELSRAAAMVGEGNLGIRLPEQRPDEFGSVYRSFNRMVQRLRRARSALLRETRRTETIVAEAATGVLALDAAGRVELVNPRASAILGEELVRGAPLPRAGGVVGALHAALREFRRSGALEAGRELEVDGRILRLRLRRLAGVEGLRGTVVALEDVTSEIRTARVLAWGEMAQQVAHEIKNPLTPIKLSVQHLRRAFADRRADFGEILERNVEAILQEIDRLGEIARAFSRFGTPEPATAQLESVEVRRAIEETLALYRGGGEAIRYRVDLDGAREARVVARMGELKEVLVNLLENAREALDGGGEIGISAAPTADGRWIEIVVWDTGEGIPPDSLPRIFEPHFSTRTSGTGLGLAIVRRMVESWGGQIDAESEPGVGTRFRIRVLAADAPGTA